MHFEGTLRVMGSIDGFLAPIIQIIGNPDIDFIVTWELFRFEGILYKAKIQIINEFGIFVKLTYFFL